MRKNGSEIHKRCENMQQQSLLSETSVSNINGLILVFLSCCSITDFKKINVLGSDCHLC